jgi:DNA-binding GntR family transcriptional regulator
VIGRGQDRAEKRFRSLTRLIAEELKRAILAGKLAPGEKLAEERLTASLKVSRVPLREALRLLEEEGYVSFLPNEEVVVSKPTLEEVEDYYSITGVLEGLATRLAVERSRPEEVARLRDLHQLLKEAYKRKDAERYFEANSRFHRFIAELARNERLFHLIDQMRQEIRKARIVSLHLPQRLDYSMREHDQIMDAFLKKNPELAEAMVIKHLQNHMAALKRALHGSTGSQSRGESKDG